MTHDLGRKVISLLVCSMILQLGVIAYVFYQSYQGRVDLVSGQRAGCERSKKDRRKNSEGWREAQKARVASNDFDVAKKYRNIADSLEERSQIDCSTAFPNARLLP